MAQLDPLEVLGKPVVISGKGCAFSGLFYPFQWPVSGVRNEGLPGDQVRYGLFSAPPIPAEAYLTLPPTPDMSLDFERSVVQALPIWGIPFLHLGAD